MIYALHSVAVGLVRFKRILEILTQKQRLSFNGENISVDKK